MGQRESKLSRDIMAALRAEGWFCFKVHGNEYMMAGLNDIIVCAEGVFVGLETKNPGEENDVSPRQSFVHEQIRAAGGTAVVVSSVSGAVHAVRTAIRELLEKKS